MDLELIEMKATRLIEMSRTAYSVTQRYIPENRNLLLLVLDYLFYARLFFFNTPCQRCSVRKSKHNKLICDK